jgi:hypothetical protein
MNEEEKELEKSVALRLSIERMVGKKIRSAQDVVWLSDEIERKQRQRVGVNTLKRMWGYYSDEQTATRTGTLDVLANFVGFKDWQTFCKQDMGENSNFVVSRHLETKRLKEDLHIHISWQPDRDCTVRHLGDSQFVIEEIVNSKLSVGDTFECVLFIEGEPLYLNNLVHEGNPPVAYQIGSKSGVRFEVIED